MSQLPIGVLTKRFCENIQQIYRRTPMPKCNFKTSAWVLSFKFAAYFQNTFFQYHLWMAASDYQNDPIQTRIFLKEHNMNFFSDTFTSKIIRKKGHLNSLAEYSFKVMVSSFFPHGIGIGQFAHVYCNFQRFFVQRQWGKEQCNHLREQNNHGSVLIPFTNNLRLLAKLNELTELKFT